MDNNKETINYHALYTFLVNRFWICIAHHHISLYMMQRHKQKRLLYHKFWSFQSSLGIKHIIFLGKHNFLISCPKDWAVSHFLANVYMKVSKYLTGIIHRNLSTCFTEVTNDRLRKVW